MPDDAPVITPVPMFDEFDIAILLCLTGSFHQHPLRCIMRPVGFIYFYQNGVQRPVGRIEMGNGSQAMHTKRVYGTRGDERRSGATANRVLSEGNWRWSG